MSDHPVVLGKVALCPRLREVEPVGDRAGRRARRGAVVDDGEGVALPLVEPHEGHQGGEVVDLEDVFDPG